MEQERDERRENSEARGLFAEAYDLPGPFFDPANSWGGQGRGHLEFRALHEHFPELDSSPVLISVTAAKRVFASGRRPVAN